MPDKLQFRQYLIKVMFLDPVRMVNRMKVVLVQIRHIEVLAQMLVRVVEKMPVVALVMVIVAQSAKLSAQLLALVRHPVF